MEANKAYGQFRAELSSQIAFLATIAIVAALIVFLIETISFVSVGCGGSGGPVGQGTACQQTAALQNGVATETYLGLSAGLADSIVAVQYRFIGNRAALCSGVVVGTSWVLTAAHCSDGEMVESTEIIAGKSISNPDLRVPVLRSLRHPDQDLVLLQADANFNQSVPFAINTEDLSAFRGAYVEIAGYGLTETFDGGAKHFAVTQVESVGTDSIVVNGSTGAGACIGDSGGPLLLRGGDGHVAVAGLLSHGSPGCDGVDTYTRLDPLRSWVLDAVGPVGLPDDGCTLSREGRCFSGVAAWCDESGSIQGQRCPSDMRCGWSVADSGYRCVVEGPCQGFDSFGACSSGDAFAKCGQGTAILTKCGLCEKCKQSSTGGEAECSSR